MVKLKPKAFRRTITVLHTIHTAKARSSAGIEIHRLRVAIALPVDAQNCGSSGRQSWIAGPCLDGLPAAGLTRTVMVILQKNQGADDNRPWPALPITGVVRISLKYIQIRETQTTP